MIVGVADTHTALWHLFDDPRLSSAARAFIGEAARAKARIAVSSISIVEVVYLVEKGRDRECSVYRFGRCYFEPAPGPYRDRFHCRDC